MKRLLSLLTFLLLAACTRQPSPEQRAAALIAQLDITQKASLMMHPSAAVPQAGIPAYNWWNEALHGVGRNGKATVFPQPVGMAASFDETLLHEVFTAVSDNAAEAVFPLSEETFLYWSPEQRDLVPLSGDWELLYGGRSDQLQALTFRKR